jgi:hypothetical protein
VVVKGLYGSDGGILKAATIVLRGTEQEKAHEAELHGSITSFVSPAQFTVRDVQVDATCGTAVLANGLQVEVQGPLSATGHAKASTIKCEKVGDAHVVLSRVGSVGTVDATAR